MLSEGGRGDMNKTCYSPTVVRMNIPEVRCGKAAEPVEQLIPNQMRNLDPYSVTACAGRGALPPAGTFQHEIKMLSKRKWKSIIEWSQLSVFNIVRNYRSTPTLNGFQRKYDSQCLSCQNSNYRVLNWLAAIYVLYYPVLLRLYAFKIRNIWMLHL